MGNPITYQVFVSPIAPMELIGWTLCLRGSFDVSELRHHPARVPRMAISFSVNVHPKWALLTYVRRVWLFANRLNILIHCIAR